jgi:hypothetical protein
VIEIEGRLTLADRAASPYHLVAVPVERPPAALRLRLVLDPPAHDELIVDLGLFEPGSTAFGTEAFRGWSGSERSEVILAADRATPGYRPGPLPAGQWHAILGLYRIPPQGCGFRITVEAPASRPDWLAAVAPKPDARVPDPAGARGAGRPLASRRWLRGDLHAHTVHSDGAREPASVAAAARRIGLDFLAITDHNTDSHLPWLAGLGGPDLVILPGEEITTYAGHANALGIRHWVDFRPDVGPGIAGSIEAVHAQGGLVSVNHPKPDDPWLHDPNLPIDAVEVWNGSWPGSEPRHANATSLGWWLGLLARGLRPTAVGGSDMHGISPDGQPIGLPTTWVRSEDRSVPAILEGIRSGRVVVSRDPIGPRPDLRIVAPTGRSVEIGDQLELDPAGPLEVAWRVVGGRGMVARLASIRGPEASLPIDTGDARGTIELAAPHGGRPAHDHIRLEVVLPDGALAALTNPIHLVHPGAQREEVAP